jgi:hypothetical protein
MQEIGIGDKILSLFLRIVLFVYNLTLLYLAVFQLVNDKAFVIAICIFGILCTGVYLFDGIYKTITGASSKLLRTLIYGEESAENDEENAPFGRAMKYALFLALIYISIRLFGLFLTTFLIIAVFPYVHSRQNIFISTALSCIICGGFYYLYIYRLGMSLPEGIFFGF